MITVLPVLLNPNAGSAGRDASRRIEEAMARHGVRVRLEPTLPAELEGRVAVHVAAGEAVVGIAGGDGTLRSAAQVLTGTPTALAPIPFGRRNHFARRLGLPDVDATARAVAAGDVREVALGRAGDRVFLDTAVLGAYAEVVRVREAYRPFLGTWGGTVVAWTMAWLRWPTPHLTLVSGGGERSRPVPLVWVGTGARAFPAPHQAHPTTGDGLLEVVLPPPGGRRGALRVVPALLHRHREKRFRHIERALDPLRLTSCRVEGPGSADPVEATLDGEPTTLPGPVELSLRGGTLRVVVGGAPE